jgi:DNA polymerase-1
MSASDSAPSRPAPHPQGEAHPRALKAGDHVFLVDGSNFIFRAYFQSMNQDRKYNYRSDGLPSGAVRLFCAKLFQFMREGVMGVKPTHLAIIFDKSENSFRKALYPAYKANRSAPPPDLVPQFPLMRAAVSAFGLVPVEQDTYEADDLIATYARQAREAGADVTIISADKDLMQLIRPGVTMYDPASGDQKNGKGRAERIIAEPEVVEYFGVTPDKVVDVQALAGDSTDNVPGAPGIGIKTAAQLISEYGDLDTLLARASEIRQPKRRETLTNPDIVEKVRISKTLVQLVDDAPVVTPLTDLGRADPDPVPLIAFLKAMEFTTITRRVAEAYEAEVAAIDAEPALAPGGTRAAELLAVFKAANAEGGEAGAGSSSVLPTREKVSPQATDEGGTTTPSPGPAGHPLPQGERESGHGSLAASRLAELKRIPIDHARYEMVSDAARLAQWIAMAREAGVVAVDTETSALDAMAADLVGVSLAVAPGQACYIPLGHRGGSDLFGGGLAEGQMRAAEALSLLKPLLEDASVLKIGQNLKYDWLVFARHGIAIGPYDDTMLISYVLDAGLHGHGMDELSELHLGHKPISFSEVAGSGKSAISFAEVALDKAIAYAAEDADITLRLWLALKPRLAAEGKLTVYETLERPLVGVLARMERAGIAIDRAILSRLSGEFGQRMGAMEEGIHEAAGERFLISSPKQLGDILFGKMGLPGGKKTASGQWSTTASVLEDLAEEGHALPRMIVDWRQLAKLKSTYTDALPTYVNGETGRVHTSFSLAATTTGRLSSSEPNIQNIPIRTEEGRKIRTAFVAEKGNRLISADYSQIELRLLAHIADIPALKTAFAEGIDIHAMTASEMFGVPVKDMTPEVRRRAKAINFGIIYGISAFGLANQLGIPREEAGQYIRTYFERFPGIRDYMEATKAYARAHGHVRTIFGRICHYPAIASKNPSERAFVERQAINAPIQGSAADIIRRAMARMEDALEAAKLSSVKMLLQVHDELVFEAPEPEVQRAIPVITRVMEDAPTPAVHLSVPLVVEAKAAMNWDEAH